MEATDLFDEVLSEVPGNKYVNSLNYDDPGFKKFADALSPAEAKTLIEELNKFLKVSFDYFERTYGRRKFVRRGLFFGIDSLGAEASVRFNVLSKFVNSRIDVVKEKSDEERVMDTMEADVAKAEKMLASTTDANVVREHLRISRQMLEDAKKSNGSTRDISITHAENLISLGELRLLELGVEENVASAPAPSPAPGNVPAPQPQQPTKEVQSEDETKDNKNNTILYVGIGVACLGAIYLLTSKKKK